MELRSEPLNHSPFRLSARVIYKAQIQYFSMGEIKVFHDKVLECFQLCGHLALPGSPGMAGEECQTDGSGEGEEKCTAG